MTLRAMIRRQLLAQRTAPRAVTHQSVVALNDLGYGQRLTIRGESNYLPHLLRLKQRSDTWQALLVREPRNRYDANAVAVHIEGACVGYVAREQAAELASYLDDLKRRGFCAGLSVTLFGGTPDKPNIGVFAD
jgi:hypothetical protein